MNIFFTSDTHFSHHNIIEYDQRPFKDVKEMNEKIISNWNAKVPEKSIVYHLGDFGFGKVEELKKIRDQLNGSLCLIRGNHDESINKMHEVGFDGIANELTLHYKGIIFVLTHDKDLTYADVKGTLNVHGHTHSPHKFHKNFINVCTSAWGYTPIGFDELLFEYKQQGRR